MADVVGGGLTRPSGRCAECSAPGPDVRLPYCDDCRDMVAAERCRPPSGRELDELIVEEVYGWKPVHVGPDADGENESEVLCPGGVRPRECVWPRKGRIGRGFLAPEYSRGHRLALRLAVGVGQGDAPLKHFVNREAEEISRSALERWRRDRRAERRKENGWYERSGEQEEG